MVSKQAGRRRRIGRGRHVISPMPLAFPPPPGCHEAPRWTGRAFLVDGREERVLAYGAAPSGWNDDLTALHESTSGSQHFIDIASRNHAIREARRVTAGAGRLVLEVGVSSGYLLAELIVALPEATVLGADYTYGTLEKAATRLPPDVPLLQFDLTQCPLPSASIDTVVLLNVLEHIEHDEAAVGHLHRILKPNGVAIIEVPSGEGLYDSYDKALLHWRRYRMSRLINLIGDAGLRVERKSHLGFFLYPGFYAAKKLGRARPADQQHLDATVQHSITWTSRIGAAAALTLSWEAWLREQIYLPFGIRCLVTARKATP
jgi:SAM-dependent methyltransferase